MGAPEHVPGLPCPESGPETYFSIVHIINFRQYAYSTLQMQSMFCFDMTRKITTKIYATD